MSKLDNRRVVFADQVDRALQLGIASFSSLFAMAIAVSR
jgi:hypothetical protein